MRENKISSKFIFTFFKLIDIISGVKTTKAV